MYVNEKWDAFFVGRFRENGSGCWLWKGATNGKGYGTWSIWDSKGHRSVNWKAHRYSWSFKNGQIPKGLFVMHACDVRRCINPAHLFIGTAADNNKDMVRKERHVWGRKVTTAKLSNAKARRIAAMKGRVSSCRVASRYGVNRSTIQSVWSGKSWTRALRAAGETI